ncbi:unnamed protein product, partial [Polarella glacialis]
VVDLDPGTRPGNWIASAHVRRSRKLSEALDASLLFCARVLSCETREELFGAEWQQLGKQDAMSFKGLEGLPPARRRAAISVLQAAVQATLATFETSPEKDEKLLAGIQTDANRRVAVAYRLEKKRLLADIFALLERADDREVELRVKKNAEADLPSAVSGRKRPAAAGSRGFK